MQKRLKYVIFLIKNETMISFWYEIAFINIFALFVFIYFLIPLIIYSAILLVKERSSFYGILVVASMVWLVVSITLLFLNSVNSSYLFWVVHLLLYTGLVGFYFYKFLRKKENADDEIDGE